MSPAIEIQFIVALVAIACAIPGVFLVLRKMALISDAICHSILPGIVVGFFLTQNLNSPWLIVLAALSGVLTVVLVEFIQKTDLVKEDTAIGLVFPALFSIGVILIAIYANDVHLDVDAVFLGELAFAPFDRLLINGVDVGAKSIWVVGTTVIVTIGLLLLFFKELKLSTFDAGLSASLGFAPAIIHYGLMTMTSFTTVVSFEAVGAILVVALIIAPAATAYLITHNLKKMILLSITFGVLAALIGHWFALLFDVSIAGTITTVLGLNFLLVYLFAPHSGAITGIYTHKRQVVEVALLTMLLDLSKNNSKQEVLEVQQKLGWKKKKYNQVMQLAQEKELVILGDNMVAISTKGKAFIHQAFAIILGNEQASETKLDEDFILFRDGV